MNVQVHAYVRTLRSQAELTWNKVDYSVKIKGQFIATQPDATKPRSVRSRRVDNRISQSVIIRLSLDISVGGIGSGRVALLGLNRVAS